LEATDDGTIDDGWPLETTSTLTMAPTSMATHK
jgi:hypothetical protein